MKVCLLAYADHHVRELNRFLDSFSEDKKFLQNFIVYHGSGRVLQKEDTLMSVECFLPKDNFFLKLVRYFIAKFFKKFHALTFLSEGILKFFLFKYFLKKNAVTTVVLFEANIGYGSEFFLKACRKKNIQVLIFPYSFSNWLDPCVSYYNRGDRSFKKIPRGAPKKWFKEFHGKFISRLPPLTAFFLDIMKFSPPAPTAQDNASFGTYLLESKAFCHHLLQEGITPERLVEFGGYNFSLLSAATVARERSIQSIRILFQVPPDITNTKYFYKLETNSYADYLSKIYKIFSKYEGRVVFELAHHPLSQKQDKIDILNKNIIEKNNVSIFEQITECDAYIACISSTIRWALALELPVINLDLYKFGYPDFSSANSLAFVDTLQDFETMLNHLVEYLSSPLNHAFPINSGYWGKVDNSFAKKFIEYVRSH